MDSITLETHKGLIINRKRAWGQRHYGFYQTPNIWRVNMLDSSWMLADLPFGGRPVGRSFVVKRESCLCLIRSQLKSGEDEACWTSLLGTGQHPVFQGHRCQLYMIFHQASSGGSTEVPSEIIDSYCGPIASREQYWAKKYCKVWGTLFCLISLNCELWWLRWT